MASHSDSSPMSSSGQIMSPDITSPQVRPYRSHKFPACDRCRKRKLRCAVEILGQPCRLCQDSTSECKRSEKRKGPSRPNASQSSQPREHAESSLSSPTNHGRTSFRDGMRRPWPSQQLNDSTTSNPLSAQRYNVSHAQKDFPSTSDRGSKSSMIVGPVMAEDVQVIENYISSQDHNPLSPHTNRYDTVSDNPEDPVLYLTVPRKREGLTSPTRPGEAQREILEQILGPHIDDVIALYFEHIHPAFPVIDEEHLIQLYRAGNKDLSAALVCDLLASSIVYWYRSDKLRHFPQPDVRYVWNLAVAAIQEEFLAPGMSTINAALLDLGGRPVMSITGNTITCGRTVALSHVLGLNRDPSSWRISESEKNMRIRLWWGVLIHDRWSSFAHGVPPNVAKNQYEVPLPTVSGLMTRGLETFERQQTAKCFIALCTLTEILGDILPLVYDRRKRPSIDAKKTLRRFETDLDNWEDSEPAQSILESRNTMPCISGSSSLVLGFLSVKMLICRIAFRSATHSTETGLVEVKSYSEAMLRESARAIATFLCSLSSHNLSEFWSPYTAYHIASATIILLRCTIETTDSTVSESCKISLCALLEWLRQAKEQYKWDLADICLAQCEGAIIEICRIRRGSSNQNGRTTEFETPQFGRNGMTPVEFAGIDSTMFNFNGYDGGVHFGPSVMDTQNSVNGFEYPWADLWDLF